MSSSSGSVPPPSSPASSSAAAGGSSPPSSQLGFLRSVLGLWSAASPVPDDPVQYERALIDAVLRNQPQRLMSLLVARPDCYHDDDALLATHGGRSRLTLLHMACSAGAAESVAVLLKRASAGASGTPASAPPAACINAVERSGSTPLHFAARNGHKACVVLLLAAGADVHRATNEGFTALHWVASNGRLDLVRLLVEAQAGQAQGHPSLDATLDNNGYTALHMACQNGHVDVVRYLVHERGMSVHAPDKQQRTPLFFACRYGQTECARCLIAAGATVTTDAKGDTPLHWAVAGAYKDCTVLLVRSFPHLMARMPNVAVSLAIEEASLLKILKHLCDLDTTSSSSSSYTAAILTGFAAKAATTGQSLLCRNPDVADLEPALLRLVHALSLLITHLRTAASPSDSTSTSTSTSTSIQMGSPSSRRFRPPPAEEAVALPPRSLDVAIQAAFDELEPLWLTMESWFAFMLDNKDDDEHLALFLDKLSAVLHAFYLFCQVASSNDDSSSPPKRFTLFISKYAGVLHAFIAHQPSVLFQQFHFMLAHVELMAPFLAFVRSQPLETRRRWFYDNLSAQAASTDHYDDLTHFLLVSRSNVLGNTCEQLSAASMDSLKHSLNIRFKDEAGQGPGVRREWFDILTREILNPDYALFKPSTDGATVQPNPDSYINADHLNFFRFAGRVIGLALYHRQALDVYFTRSFYKHILGIPVSYEDMESINPKCHKSLQWLLDHEIDSPEDGAASGLDLTFSMDDNVFGSTSNVELKPGGVHIAVNDANKREFVQLMTERIMTIAIADQIGAFLDGFHELVPHSLIAMFDAYELELLISGVPQIDLDDWRHNTTYIDFEATDEQIEWFWQLVGDLPHQDRVLLLQFVTGSSRVPMGGFAQLLGADGPSKFTISLLKPRTKTATATALETRLPTSSTCVNTLKMPAYASKDVLRDRLLTALRFGSKGFELV